jgi:hypothetical protein
MLWATVNCRGSAARLGSVMLAVETTPRALSEVVSRAEWVGR